LAPQAAAAAAAKPDFGTTSTVFMGHKTQAFAPHTASAFNAAPAADMLMSPRGGVPMLADRHAAPGDLLITVPVRNDWPSSSIKQIMV